MGVEGGDRVHVLGPIYTETALELGDFHTFHKCVRKPLIPTHAHSLVQ